MIIEVASGIAMVAIGTGAQRRIAEQLENVGTNCLVIRPGSVPHGEVCTGVGGLLGIVLGLARASAVARFSQLPVEITPTSVLIAFLFAGLAGVFFGLHPALKAARLRPIDALCYE